MTDSILRRYRLIIAMILACITLISRATPVQADPVTDYNVAIEFYRQNRWDLAADACREFLKRYPDHERAAAARLYLAQSLLHLKDFKAAREQYRLFVQQAPGHADMPLAEYRLGECSFFLGDDAQAEKDLGTFLKKYPRHELAEWASLYLGESQLRRQQPAAAVSTFEQALKSFPGGNLADDLEFNLATAYDAAGKPEQAAQIYQEISDRPGSAHAADSLFKMATRDFEGKKYDSAAELFSKTATRFPDHRLAGSAQLNAGYALFHLGKYDPAIQAFQQAAVDSQLTATALYWEGLSEKARKNYQAAADIFAKSLEEQPNQPIADKVTFHAADARFRSGHPEQAMKLFESVPAKWPKSDLADDAVHSACEVALQSDRLDEALRLNQQFQKTYPDSSLKLVQDLLFARVLIARSATGSDASTAAADLQQAESVLQQVLKQSTLERTRTYARFQLARVYERQKQDDNLIHILKPVLDAGNTDDTPERLDAHLMTANALLRQDKTADAARQYQQFLKLSKSPVDRNLGLTGLVRAQAKLQDWPAVMQHVKELEQNDTADAYFSSTAMAAGDAAFDQKQWKIAAEIFRLIAARSTDGAYYLPALSGLAHAEYESGEFTASAAGFSTLMSAAQADPILASHAAYMQALSLQRAGKTAEALTAYRAAAEKFRRPEKSGPLSDKDLQIAQNALQSARGGARLAREQADRKTADFLYDLAWQELRNLPADKQQDLDQLLNEWANLAYSAEDYPRSDELYRRLLTECPDSPLANDAALILAESARFSGQTETAQKEFRRLVQKPGVSAFIRQRSLVHLLDLAAEQGRWSDTRKVAEQLRADDPQGQHAGYATYRLGEALLQQKKYAESLQILTDFKNSLAQNLSQAPPWWAEIWLLTAECQYWQKDYAALEATLADLQSKFPPPNVDYRANALLGRSLENRARFEEAREAYRKVTDSEQGRGTETAAEAQFRIAESYLKENNLPVALREYYKVYAGYDAPKFEAAALFQAGSCDVSLKHYAQAKTTYQKLIGEFPESEFTKQAKDRLAELEALEPSAPPATPSPENSK